MSYIWESYSDEKEYRIGDKICPYIEVFNQHPQAVDVNPLLRLSSIFKAAVSDEQGTVYAFDILREQIGDEGNEQVVNVLFHFLAQLDKTKGLSPTQQVVEKLRDEIERGMWGSKVQDSFKGLTERDKDCILYVLSSRIQKDNRSFFMEAVGKCFPFSSLCYEEKTDLYYLYIGVAETDYNINKLDVIKALFWNINRKLLPVWDYHYGIVGCNDTMHIDSIQIV